MEFRKYQVEAIYKALNYIQDGKNYRKPFIVSPTGSGKSWIIAGIAHKVDFPVIVLQPSKELLMQNYSKYTMLGNEASIFSASLNTKDIGHVTFATIGSIKDRVEDFKKIGVKLILIDECHIGGAGNSMLNRFIKKFGNIKVIGLTATPVILRSTLIGSVLKMLNRTKDSFFSYPLHITQIKEVVEQGYWSNLEYDVINFDRSPLRRNSSGSEYTDSSIEIAYDINRMDEVVVNKVNSVRDKVNSILIFCPSIQKANELCTKIQDSHVVHSNMPDKERDRIITLFKANKIKIVINVNILAIGFDKEELDYIIDTVPTASIGKYYQKIGRGTRIFPGKEKCTIVDCSGNYETFGDVRDITFEEDPRLGWGMFNKNRLLSGVPLFGEPVYKTKEEDLNKKYVFTFGKHQGKPIDKIPRDYLRWVLENFSWNSSNIHIKKEIKKELDGTTV